MNDLDVLRAFGADLDTMDAPATAGAPTHLRRRIVTGIAGDGHGHPTVDQAALDAGVQPLERRWRQAADPPPAGRTARRTIGGHGWQLQLVAATMAAIVMAAGGALLSNIVSQRGSADAGEPAATESQRGSADPGEPAATVRSFRVTVQHEDGRPTIFNFVDGRVLLDHLRQFDEPAAWRGFGTAEPVVVDQEMISGDELYLHARTSAQEQSRWYRYSGTRLNGDPAWTEELTGMTLPVFTEGTRGFRRVDDAEAAAQGLTRYSANVASTARADLESFGFFSPWAGNMNYAESGENSATLDIWVDAGGRVHRMDQVVFGEGRTRTTFDHFDKAPPIDLPSGDVPAATDAWGMTLTAVGDPALAEELREQVSAALDGDEHVESYRFLDKPTPEQDRIDDTRPTPDDRIFIVAVRLTGDRPSDTQTDPFGDLSVWSGDRSAEIQPAQTHWLELGG
jgi:hypothetical protein